MNRQEIRAVHKEIVRGIRSLKQEIRNPEPMPEHTPGNHLNKDLNKDCPCCQWWRRKWKAEAEFLALRREIRHRHIAYCLLRGLQLDQVERPNSTGRDDALVQKFIKDYQDLGTPWKSQSSTLSSTQA